MEHQFKLAFSTLGCPDWNFKQVVAQASAMGFAAIEVRGIGEELQTSRLSCFLPENQEASRQMLNDAGITICGIGTSVSFHDAANTESALTEGREAIDICNAMGIPAIRVFGDCFPVPEEKEIVIERVAKGLSTLCDYAEKTGNVQVLLEVHGQFNTIEVLTSLIKQMNDHSAFGLIWDIEHSFRAYGNDFMPFYSTIRSYIRHIHIKDCRMESDQPIQLLLGEGDINISSIIQVLKQDGYDGYYSFEWEKRWQPNIPEPEEAFPHYVRYMKSL